MHFRFTTLTVLGCVPTRRGENQLLPFSGTLLFRISKVCIRKLFKIKNYITGDIFRRLKRDFHRFKRKMFFLSFLIIWPTMGHIGSHNSRGKTNQQNLKKRICYIYIVLSICEKKNFCFTTFVHPVDRAYTNGLLITA